MLQTIRWVIGSRTKKEHSTTHRLDIQGLRTIAVGLVIADHLFGKPIGGFIGVDVFFVISGFLITGLLLREGERQGQISILNFYKRRIRRILPASLVVLGVTVVASYILLVTSRFESVRTDGVWALFFSVNWHLAAVGTDYFQAALPPSPLQHYWSLAVEEQFYVVWPLVLIGLLLAARRARGRGGSLHVATWAGGFAALAVAVSFAWAVYQSDADPTVAYFSTLTRAWELGIGALLAAVGPALMRRADNVALRNGLALAGYAALIYGALTISPSDPFPAPIGAIPVLGTALLIASGIGSDKPVAATRPISLAPITYLGDLSYSLYLWHWPIIVLGLAVYDDTTLFKLSALALTLLVSAASYHGIEQPVLKSDFLAPTMPGQSRRQRRHESNSRQHTGYVAAGALAFVTVLVVALALTPKDPPPLSDAQAAAQAEQQQQAALQAAEASGEDWVQVGLTDALESEEFPPLAPPLDDAKSAMAPSMDPTEGCFNPKDLGDADQCTFGDPAAEKLAVVVGDSIGMSWVPGVRAALEDSGYRVHAVGLSDCPFASVAVDLDIAALDQRCDKDHDKVLQQVRRLAPDLVVASDYEAGITRLASGATGNAAIQEWRGGVVAAIDTVRTPGTDVVVLSSNPGGPSAADCATRFSAPADCVGTIQTRWLDKRQAEQAAAETAGARYIDTSSWFCLGERCPLFALGTTIRWDNAHLTSNYAELLKPKLVAALLDQPEVAPTSGTS